MLFVLHVIRFTNKWYKHTILRLKMGSFFSKTPRPLQEQLLTQYASILSGDLLLVPSTELEVALNSEMWAHVGMIVRIGDKYQVYHGGIFEDIDEYVSRHPSIQLRQLKTDIGQETIYQFAQQSAETMMTTTVDQCDREGYAIAIVLQLMGLIGTKRLVGIRPYHFAVSDELLPYYSEASELGFSPLL